MDVYRFVRGGIWWHMDTIPDKSEGERGVTRGDRPVLIISNVSNPTSTCTITYLPISKMVSAAEIGEAKLKALYAVPIEIAGRGTCYVQCNQPTTSVTNHLKGYVGQCTPTKMKEVEQEFLRYLRLNGAEEHPCVNDTTTEEYTSKGEVSNSPRVDSSRPDDPIYPEDTAKTVSRKRVAKAVQCVDTGVTYTSAKAAAEACGLRPAQVYKILNGYVKNPSVRFKYAD